MEVLFINQIICVKQSKISSIKVLMVIIEEIKKIVTNQNNHKFLDRL